jgi:hypothetical protein
MPTTVEDILESVTTGVLRALDARKAGSQKTAVDTATLVRSGFAVVLHIRAGGLPGASLQQAAAAPALSPQSLPPGSNQ